MRPLTAPPHDQVDFLPDWYRQAQHRRASLRRQIVLLSIMAVSMALLAITIHRSNHKLRHETLEGRLQQIDLAQGRVNEMARLQKEKRVLASEVRIYRRLARPINYSEITGTLDMLRPDQISLTELHVHTETIEMVQSADAPVPAGATVRKKSSRKPGKKAKTVTISYPVVVIEAEGHAPSNIDIANFVGRLHGSGLFRSVKMANSREGDVDNIVTRQFRISMEVPLNVVYKKSSREEVVHADG